MNRKDLAPIDRLLADELAGIEPAPGASEGHPESHELALYLDGGLAGGELERLEGHLASCSECRRTAMETALAEAGSEPPEAAEPGRRAAPWWRPWRSGEGLVAVLATVLAGIALAFFLPPGEPRSAAGRLARAGVPDALLASLEPSSVQRAAAVLDGEWPRAEGFELFLSDGRPALRGPSFAVAPSLVAPRWSVVDASRPHFVCQLDFAAAEIELLVIDEQEELVATARTPTAGEPGELSLAYPEDAAPLLPGRAYAWKVNAHAGGEWVASSYVPFRRATGEESARLATELANVEASPLLQVVALGSAGRFPRALDAARGLEPALRSRLLRSLLGQQHYSEPELERELERWLGMPDPP